MRKIALVAMVAALLAPVYLTAVYGQGGAPPVPPARENKMGDVILESGQKVTADEYKTVAPATAAAAMPAPVAAPSVPAIPAAPATAPNIDPTPTPAPVAPAAVVPAPPALVVPAAAPVAPVAPTPAVPAEPAWVAPTAPVVAKPVGPTVPALPVEEQPTAPRSRERPMEMQVPPAMPATSLRGEVETVEHLAVARETYRTSLEALKQYYVSAGNATKLAWVEKELAGFEAADKYHYLNEMELSGADLHGSMSIPAADQLFREAMEFKSYPAWPDIKKEKLRVALQKFRTIITDYPMSDKIAPAAFRMGEIFEGFYYQDPVRAVQCYERCWQWNPKTEYPARFNAAKLYDEKLLNRAKAVELYNIVVLEDSSKDHVKYALERIKALTGKP